MGKEKRLFLLAVMTVMMSTAGYSEVIQIGAGDNKTITDTEYKNGNSYQITAGVSKEKPTKVFNETNMIFNSGTGIKFNKNKNFSNGKIEFTNNKKIKIDAKNKKVTGISVAYGKLSNVGEIEIAGENGLGIYVSNGAVVENTGKITVGDKGTGLSLVHNTSEVTNSGLIDVTQEGTGIKISKGTLINTGVKDKDDSGIVASGDKSVGIRLEGTGKVENKDGGIIKGTNQGVGILVSSGTFINSSAGKVNGVIGIDSGIGIKIEGTGKVENTGKISALGKNGIGVDISNGEFTNKRGATISVGGSGIGINISGGKFENKNIISAQKGTGKFVALWN